MKHLGLVLLCLLSSLSTRIAAAQESSTDSLRRANFVWKDRETNLVANFDFGDVIDPPIKAKLSRGLPTRILLTGVLYLSGTNVPIASTFQTCKITWHVWEEMYRVEITTPASPASKKHWTPTLTGVIRRCATATELLVANRTQLALDAAVYLKATVLINPISAELQRKLKRWVSRPSTTATAAPGSALFSTFTGLFMQRFGEAERRLSFTTVAAHTQRPTPGAE